MCGFLRHAQTCWGYSVRKRRKPGARIIEIAGRLAASYPSSNLGNRADPLEEAVYIILSSQTDEAKYQETWRAFRRTFPTMRAAAEASRAMIARAIRSGGLARWKAARIKRLLSQVKEATGRYSLRPLSGLDDSALETALLKLDGIGIKSARCVMMYSFGRAVFPVDVHSSRLARRLGFAMPKAGVRTRRYADGIQQQVPPSLRHGMHVNLVQHGRAVCTSRRPKCSACCVNDLCQTGVRGRGALR